MLNKYFWFTAVFCLVLLMFRDAIFLDSIPYPMQKEMLQAVTLAKSWEKIIVEEKRERGIFPTSISREMTGDGAESAFIIGDEYSVVTSTLGSLESKQISNNPLFAALILRLIDEANIDSNEAIGVLASGSFPALTTQTLAALQVLNRDVVLITSLGSSSFGANQPGALWTDMEYWLQYKGGCRYQSDLITYGAEGDTAGGIPEEGLEAFNASLVRTHKHVFVPASVQASMQKKLDIFLSRKIGLLINIGGNQSALGYCSHAESIPNGLHSEINTCSHAEKGIIAKISAMGIPYIHLLHMQNLAARYSITDHNAGSTHPLFSLQLYNKLHIIVAVFVILLGMYLYYRERKIIDE